MKRRKFISEVALSGIAITAMPTSLFGNYSKKDKSVYEVLDYIKANWEKSIYKDANGSGFQGFDLPYPYTTPSIKGQGRFTFFFYWDTYFTNLGLLRNGYEDQVKNNIKNMLFLIEEHGYMPNHVAIYNRAQSPYFQQIVSDYFAKVNNESKEFVKSCAEGVRREYQYWMTARFSGTGLNHFGHHEDDQGCIDFYNGPYARRLKLSMDVPDEEKIIKGGHGMAEAENWDFNYKYDNRAIDFNAVDLNSLLWGYEKFLYSASKENGWALTDFYLKRAEKREALINKYLWNDEKGWFFDYDYVNKKQSEILYISGMQPMFMGLATKEQAAKMVKNIHLLETDYGITTSVEFPDYARYQWAYPVLWPPMVYLTVKALDNYGYTEDAKRIAHKYIDVSTNLFKKHGKLYEKIDGITGELDNSEYESDPQMGWSAGVYVALAEYLGFK